MPSKSKLSPKARADQLKKDNDVNLVQAKVKLAGSNVVTSSDGVTKIYSNFYNTFLHSVVYCYRLN